MKTLKKIEKPKFSFEEKGYKYMPAALIYGNFGGLGMYIKYKKSKNDEIKIIDQNNQYVHLKCPDRELFITKDSNHEHHLRPIESGFDEFVSFSAFHKSCNDFGLEMIMNNYAASLEKKDSDTDSIVNGKCNNNVVTVTDSGGFQFLSSVDYLDPVLIAEWYNRNTHLGMVLDIPVYYGMPIDVLKRAAEVQRKNTEIMLKTKNENVELINIIHGYDRKSYGIYRDIIETKEIDRICVGDVYRSSVLNCIDNILETVTKGRKYKHYHVLGVYNLKILPILIKIANSGLCEFLTSDSSTAVRSAAMRSYHVIRNFTAGVESLNLGITGKSVIDSTNKVLPCSCPVCSKLKYTDILAIIEGDHSTRLLAMHNLYIQNNYTKTLQDSCRSMSRKEYRDLIAMQLGKTSEIGPQKSLKAGNDEVLQALDFVDMVVDYGLEAARKKYAYFLESNLLSDSAELTPLLTENEDVTTEEVEDYPKRFLKILDNYESKNENQHGKKNKNKKGSSTVMFSKSKKSAKGLKKKSKKRKNK